MDEGESRFTQTYGTPFTISPLIEDFGFLAETPQADAVLQGTYVPAENVDPYAKKFIQQLKQPCPPLPILQHDTSTQAHKDGWKKNKVERLVLMLKGAMAANQKVGMLMNVPRKNLDAVMKILPPGVKPTIANLTDEKWVDLTVILEEKLVREIVPDLKQAGAEDIVEFPLNKIIH